MEDKKKLLNISIKISFSLIVLAILFHEVHIRQLIPYLKIIHFNTLLLAPTIILISNIIAAYRWGLVMNTLKFPKQAIFYLTIYLKSVMFNQVLPTNIGGDAYRMLEARKCGKGNKLAITSVLTDRVYGFLGLVLINVFCLVATYRLLPHIGFYIILLTTIGCISAVTGIYCLRYIRIQLLQTYLRWFYDLSETMRQSFSSTTDLCWKLALGMLTNFLNVMSFYIIARALGIHAGLIDFAIIVPSVMLLSMVPISMAGWGIREGAMVFLGAAMGIAKAAALAISLLYGVSLIAVSLPGFYLYFLHKSSHIGRSAWKPQ